MSIVDLGFEIGCLIVALAGWCLLILFRYRPKESQRNFDYDTRSGIVHLILGGIFLFAGIALFRAQTLLGENVTAFLGLRHIRWASGVLMVCQGLWLLMEAMKGLDSPGPENNPLPDSCIHESPVYKWFWLMTAAILFLWLIFIIFSVRFNLAYSARNIGGAIFTFFLLLHLSFAFIERELQGVFVGGLIGAGLSLIFRSTERMVFFLEMSLISGIALGIAKQKLETVKVEKMSQNKDTKSKVVRLPISQDTSNQTAKAQATVRVPVENSHLAIPDVFDEKLIHQQLATLASQPNLLEQYIQRLKSKFTKNNEVALLNYWSQFYKEAEKVVGARTKLKRAQTDYQQVEYEGDIKLAQKEAEIAKHMADKEEHITRAERTRYERTKFDSNRETEEEVLDEDDIKISQQRERIRKDKRFQIDLEEGAHIMELEELEEWKRQQRKRVNRNNKLSYEIKEDLFDEIDRVYNERRKAIKDRKTIRIDEDD